MLQYLALKLPCVMIRSVPKGILKSVLRVCCPALGHWPGLHDASLSPHLTFLSLIQGFLSPAFLSRLYCFLTQVCIFLNCELSYCPVRLRVVYVRAGEFTGRIVSFNSSC